MSTNIERRGQSKKKFHEAALVPADPCGHISCVCEIGRQHIKGCKFLLAATCAIAIECPHGYDVCPKCDPCTCEEVRNGVRKVRKS